MTTPEQPILDVPKEKFTLERLSCYYKLNPTPDFLKGYLILQNGPYTFTLMGENDAGNNIHPTLISGVSPERLGSALSGIIKNEHDKWQKTFDQYGPIADSARIFIGNAVVNMFAYGSKNNGRFEQIAQAYSTLANKTPLIRDHAPSNLILLPTGMETGRKALGNNPNGRAINELNSIVFFPHMFEEPHHRLPGVDNITGTIAHEFMHFFDHNGSLYIPWWNYMDPVYIWNTEQNSYVFTGVTEQPCITEYAHDNGILEDIADSGAAALLKPELLQEKWSKKYALLSSFLKLHTDLPALDIKLIQTKEAEPQYPTQFLYMFGIIRLKKTEQPLTDPPPSKSAREPR